MKVLVLGATGLIGTAVTKELLQTGHEVTGLCRTERSAAHLERLGATPLRGDLEDPAPWAGVVATIDGIIQTAATFEDDMGSVDWCVLAALMQAAETAGSRPRFIYTGGCWLYGETGDVVASEESPFNPLPGVVRPKRTGLSLSGFRRFRRQVAAILPARFAGSP
ncbi:NAD-dependent epimerase/dehydratase family protein [Hyphobacterium sp.]|uniref:NAD-dependent epimerase/dehydratase family protein n=1 Tax=Hyphobacterium sp. TaxID=2004662 RepID=UPI003748B043